MRQGFTLIEALVVVGITIAMAGVLLAYNRESERHLALMVSQARVVGALSRAKAFTLEKYAGGLATSTACAFGVYVNSGVSPVTLSLFQDLPQAGERCLSLNGFPTFNTVFDPTNGELVEEIRLDSRVNVTGPSTLTFEAPYLRVYADGVLITAPSVVTIDAGSATLPVAVVVGLGGDIGTQSP